MRIANGFAPLCLAFALTFAGRVSAGPPAQATVPPAAVVLFNGKNLNGWSIHVRHADRSDPSADPKGVFKVENGLIHVSGEEFACLTTDEVYSDYRISVDFKWGEKRWPPRENRARDSGVLVHVVEPIKVWPRSIECQIQEHDCGDFYLVDGATIQIDGRVEKSYRKKTDDNERPHGEWNTVEVVCEGGNVTNIVNGKVVNKGTDASLRRGRIVLQSEGAEIFFRNVVLTPLK